MQPPHLFDELGLFCSSFIITVNELLCSRAGMVCAGITFGGIFIIDFLFYKFTTGNSLGDYKLLLVICFGKLRSGIAAAFELFLSSKSNIFDSDCCVASSDSFNISGNVSYIIVKLLPSLLLCDFFMPVIVQLNPSCSNTSRS
jgi:hypothetical protein